MHRRPAVRGANCVWSWLLRVCSRWRQGRRRGHSRHGRVGIRCQQRNARDQRRRRTRL